MSNDSQPAKKNGRRRRRRRSRGASSKLRKLRPLVVPVLLAMVLGVASVGLWGWWNAPPDIPLPTLVSVPDFSEGDLPPAVRARLKVATEQHRTVENSEKSTLVQKGRAWRLWGEEFLIAELWPQAAACLQNSTVLRPREWQDHYLLALAQSRSDDVPAALTSMESALKLMQQPPKADVIDQVNAWCFVASMALRQEDSEKAEQALSKALVLDSRCVFALFHRGRLHYQKDRLEEALKDLGAANRIYPDSAPIRAVLLAVHTKRKNEFAARQFAPRPATNPRDAVDPECPERILSRVLADERPSR